MSGRRCECGAKAEAGGLCKRCRFREMGLARRKYNWTPELVRALRAAYAQPTRRKMSAAVSDLARAVGWPRHAFAHKAIELGFTYSARRWSEKDVAFLEEHLGSMPVVKIARRLNRSPQSVHCKALQLGRSARLTDGYTQNDLEELLGVSHQRVRRWIRNGWLRVRDGRVDERDLVKFLRKHADEYDLGFVNQVWWKAVVFA